ncbi:RNA polymerase sigma factor [Virgibacillus natechei]
MDKRFQWFYLEVRMVHYTDKLARLYGKSYDKRKRKYRSKLILSSPVQYGEGEIDTVEQNFISSDFWLDDKIDSTIYDLLPTKAMADTYLSFSSEKKDIIYLNTFYQLNNKEIARILECTPQNVSKMKVKAIKQLKEEKVYG